MPTAKALRCSHAKRVVYEDQLPSTLLLNIKRVAIKTTLLRNMNKNLKRFYINF